jgi:flagellar secretion chaperone FliS
MDLSAREAYLSTQILTATPQRLRLMLIEGAIRNARAAQAAWQAGNTAQGSEAIAHCRGIVSELIAGIQPEQTDVARQILGVYLFLFSTLVEAQLARDGGRLNDVLRVLDEERQTWQALCEQMPERPAPAATLIPAEEVAPQRVNDSWTPGYGAAPAALKTAGASAFSIEA